MNIKNLDNICMNCFSPMPAGAAFCTVCGHDQKSPPEAEYRLPLRTILNGKYMVGQVLGEGGFGITYVGYDLNLDIKVAVKEYYPSGFVTRTATSSSTVQTYGGEQGEIFRRGRERFVDEARRLARFRTLRGIVMVNDFFVENGTAYIVMEFVEGVTLKSYMAQQGGKLPAAQVFDMLAPVFASLSQIHEGGLIHRDISPDNIMITPDGGMKLLDFGAAREFGADDRSLSVMLKHGYAPAEQYTTRGVQGPHTDVYALSATIYKAITGVTPESAMDRVIEDVVQPPRLLGVSIAPHQETALMKGLAVRAENRWQTVGELHAALQGGVQTPPTPNAVPPVGATVPGRPPAHTPPAQTPPQRDVEDAVPYTPHAKTPIKSKKPKIIAAVVAACVVVVGIVLALTLPRGGRGIISAVGYDPTVGYNVVAVGSNENGQCDVSDWRDIATVSVGLAHTVGLRTDGTVVAVGHNGYGQCDVYAWRDIVAISVGGMHTVGLRKNGTVVAVGSNYHTSDYEAVGEAFGQCDVSEWRNIIAISAADMHTVGLKSDGTVVATGWNEYGQCDVSDWRDIVAVAVSSFHTFGLKSDGTVVSTDERYDVSAWRDIIAVTADKNSTIGLKSDGTVVAVEQNYWSEYGQRDVSDWRGIVSIAAGERHTVGLKSDGTVVAVGDNTDGQCDVSDWRDVTAIYARSYLYSYDSTVGLKSDGTVVATESHSLARGDVSAWRGIVTVAVGELHTVALTTEGSGNSGDGSTAGNATPDGGDPAPVGTGSLSGRYYLVSLVVDGKDMVRQWQENGGIDIRTTYTEFVGDNAFVRVFWAWEGEQPREERGTYTLNGDTLTLIFDNGGSDDYHISGDTLTFILDEELELEVEITEVLQKR